MSGYHRRVLDMAASGAHARQASVNEPSGARLFRGDWSIKIGYVRTSRQKFILAKRFSAVNLSATGLMQPQKEMFV